MAPFFSEASISAINFSVGKRHVAKGWSKAGISELVQAKTTLSPEDPFENIDAILV